jgi:hypothetical protein
MEVAGAAPQAFDVIAWDKAGQIQIFASYRQ